MPKDSIKRLNIDNNSKNRNSLFQSPQKLSINININNNHTNSVIANIKEIYEEEKMILLLKDKIL